MRGSKFYLNFKNDGTGMIETSEPVGLDAIEFSLKQDDKRIGRDVQVAGGNAKLEYSRMKHPEVFDHLQRYNEFFGFESMVDQIIDVGGVGDFIVIGNLDFAKANNDVLNLFKCDVILDGLQQAIKRRNETKTDLFNTLDLDDNPITPCATSKILLKSVPSIQVSKWKYGLQEPKDFTLNEDSSFNFSNAVQEYGIENTLSYIQGASESDNFRYVFAVNSLRDIKIRLTNIDVKVLGSNTTKLRISIGDDIDTATDIDLATVITGSFPTTLSLDIPFLNRGSYIWIYFRTSIPEPFGFYQFTSMDVSITATSIAYNTVNAGIRLIDAIKYNVLSISGLTVNFPMADVGGFLYNQFLFNGNLLRNISTAPFYLTFKMITEWFPEINLDYEIQTDGTVFIGTYADFYPSSEVAVLTKTQFSDYNKGFNERYTINEVDYEYKNYLSQREEDSENGNDEVHGELQLSLANKNVENKKEISVGFYRSALLIEQNRRKAMTTPASTATQDDDKIAIIDVQPSSEISGTYITFNETSNLQHFYDEDTGLLILRNDDTFSFEFLGMVAGTPFAITTSPAQLNQGAYEVLEVTRNSIILDPVGSSSPSTPNNGIRNTNFTYFIPISALAGMNWSDEGFSLIDNISSFENYYNLRFTQKRNILNYYNSYLATANLYHKLMPIKTTFYKNNPDCVTVFEGNTVAEGESFIPAEPILSPFIHELTFLTTFKEYKDIESKIRSDERGFIRCFDARGEVLKVFPQEMKFQNSAERLGELKVIGEEKLEPSLINIVDSGLPFLTINGEYMVESIVYQQKNDYFYIKDQNGLLLYNGVFYDRISVNGAVAENKAQLIEWLNLLT